ncbi:hypothetical protein JMJ77_0013981 [Colletotrichum scovillei]|uniref:Uncharacterized protein n=2 Tax=Colletotrichum scovillei TaxID=1209932 RepID=A0A9P7UBB0_9PEZI|nr:hypothetical protein JMJ77_0013981 [Colletotrichum scovillei]KAG7065531.1 hypothetical protein JMJ78_0012282 [Colletotrichum scovillei]KAG7068104.1 hypothetical protein JMJ76_0007800 [Colletotrichum scovillei]
MMATTKMATREAIRHHQMNGRGKGRQMHTPERRPPGFPELNQCAMRRCRVTITRRFASSTNQNSSRTTASERYSAIKASKI